MNTRNYSSCELTNFGMLNNLFIKKFCSCDFLLITLLITANLFISLFCCVSFFLFFFSVVLFDFIIRHMKAHFTKNISFCLSTAKFFIKIYDLLGITCKFKSDFIFTIGTAESNVFVWNKKAMFVFNLEFHLLII